jgi:hypothetical protein
VKRSYHTLENSPGGVACKRGELYVITQSPKLLYQPLAPPLQSDRTRRKAVFNISDALVQNLPNQPAEAVSDGPDRFVISQPGRQTPEDDLQMTALFLDSGVRKLVSAREVELPQPGTFGANLSGSGPWRVSALRTGPRLFKRRLAHARDARHSRSAPARLAWRLKPSAREGFKRWRAVRPGPTIICQRFAQKSGPVDCEVTGQLPKLYLNETSMSLPGPLGTARVRR